MDAESKPEQNEIANAGDVAVDEDNANGDAVNLSVIASGETVGEIHVQIGPQFLSCSASTSIRHPIRHLRSLYRIAGMPVRPASISGCQMT